MAPYIRLLICNTEGTIEEMPAYDGPPEHDDVLNYLLPKHRTAGGTEHLGTIMRVEKKFWDQPKVKAQIVSQILDKTGHTGLDPEFYDTKNTLIEDAGKCFNEHLRNPACPDYKSDAKLLTPGTKDARKDLGLSPMKSTTYLCNFCPVHSMVMQAAHDKSGIRN